MICPRCRHRNVITAAFCDECGTYLEVTCSTCQVRNRTSARFCRGCGRQLTTFPTNDHESYRPPVSYTPSYLIERVLDSKSVLEGERKQITVLFADVKGSLELISDRDPEDARRILDPVLELMMEAVHAFEGTVTQLAGDGIMALFGAPIAHEDHALRAAYAALRIQEFVQRFASESLTSHGIDVQVRVGLNSGEVVVRTIHNDLRMDYSAIGHTVHLAARMEQIARPGKILITDTTRSACIGALDITSLGPIPIKGLAIPQAVFELNGARSTRTRFRAVEQSGILSRFIGREVEIEILKRTLSLAANGNGQMVSLVGEPGVGKSRLAYELVHSPEARDFLRLEAHAFSYARQTAYLPIVSLLKSYFDVQPGDTGSEIRNRVTQKLGELDPKLADIIPTILWLFDFAESSEDWDALDPLIKRQKTFDGIKRLLFRVSCEKPLLIVLEDLQWLDSDTQAVLDVLIEIVPAGAILLFLTYRPEYQHAWSGKTFHTRIYVDPFAPDIAEVFLESLLGVDPSLSPLKSILAARTDGNPFFLEESVHALTETGALVERNGLISLGKPIKDIEIAPSIHAVLAARIDRLRPDDKWLLQSASIVGRDVPVEILTQLVDFEQQELNRSLESLQSAAFLMRRSISPPAYAFKHVLTYEVAYAGLLREQRKLLHARALQAIERLYSERLAEHVETLARHAERAENWEKAVAYLRQAGIAAAMRSSYRDAEDWQRSAIRAWESTAESRHKAEVGIDLRFDLYTAILTRGDHTPIFQVLEEAERLAISIGDEKRLARICGNLSMAYWWIADYPRAREFGHRALSLAQALGQQSLLERSIALVALAWTQSAVGEFDEAKKGLEQVVAIARVTPDRRRVNNGLPLTTVIALCWLATCHGETGEFEKGLDFAQEAVRLAEDVDQPWSRAPAYYALGSVLIKRMRIREAITVLERGRSLCAMHGIPAWGLAIAWVLGSAYALNGDAKQAVSLLDQVVRQAPADRFLWHQSLRVAFLAEAELISGRKSRAAELGQDALHLARAHGERPAEGHVLRILGDIAVETDIDDPNVPAFYEQALAIADEFSMRPLQAQCHLKIGRIVARRNETAKAAAHFGVASRMLDAMKMPTSI
jgi:class 3 adenylate cyclase/tetratricopeptide (TPR) repeat protein